MHAVFADGVNIAAVYSETSRGSVDCPGDILPFICSAQSTNETLDLTWRVTIPGETINITYSQSNYNRISLNRYITTSLIEFRKDEFAFSILEIMVNQYTPTHQIMIECSMAELLVRTISFRINQPSKIWLGVALTGYIL